MDENMNDTNSVVAPQASETQEIAEVQEDANTQDVDTQPSSEVDVDNDTGNAQPDTTDAKWENDKRSMAEKIKTLENEKNKYQKAQEILDALDAAAREDVEFSKVANRKLVEKGLLDESALSDQINTPTPAPSASQVVDPAVDWARKQMLEEQSKTAKFFEDFESSHPDLVEGDENIVKANRSAVGAVANRKMAQGGVSREEAFEFAYKAVMNPTLLVEEGKLEGLAQAQSARPSDVAASGGSSNSSGGVTLTPEQKEIASAFGITEEAYAKRLTEE